MRWPFKKASAKITHRERAAASPTPVADAMMHALNLSNQAVEIGKLAANLFQDFSTFLAVEARTDELKRDLRVSQLEAFNASVISLNAENSHVQQARASVRRVMDFLDGNPKRRDIRERVQTIRFTAADGIEKESKFLSDTRERVVFVGEIAPEGSNLQGRALDIVARIDREDKYLIKEPNGPLEIGFRVQAATRDL
jgi:hypothetical protein